MSASHSQMPVAAANLGPGILRNGESSSLCPITETSKSSAVVANPTRRVEASMAKIDAIVCIDHTICGEDLI